MPPAERGLLAPRLLVGEAGVPAEADPEQPGVDGARRDPPLQPPEEDQQAVQRLFLLAASAQNVRAVVGVPAPRLLEGQTPVWPKVKHLQPLGELCHVSAVGPTLDGHDPRAVFGSLSPRLFIGRVLVLSEAHQAPATSTWETLLLQPRNKLHHMLARIGSVVVVLQDPLAVLRVLATDLMEGQTAVLAESHNTPTVLSAPRAALQIVHEPSQMRVVDGLSLPRKGPPLTNFPHPIVGLAPPRFLVGQVAVLAKAKGGRARGTRPWQSLLAQPSRELETSWPRGSKVIKASNIVAIVWIRIERRLVGKALVLPKTKLAMAPIVRFGLLLLRQVV
mmetsp:Transcript_10738/g.28518  ORF Transcript_10738/g.28518 Transcript_10738/m.28518 type:complete len:334 (-) Transcript_10738:75-1076(-)